MKVYYIDKDGRFAGEGESAELPSNATNQKPNTQNDVWNAKKQEWITPKEPQKTKEELKKEKLKELNKQRQAELDIAKVSYKNNLYDADEVSQSRMARALLALGEDDKQFWITADDKMVELTKADFREILRLAGVNQTRIWVKYAKLKAEVENE